METARCNYCGKNFVDLAELRAFHATNSCPNAATCELPTANNPVAPALRNNKESRIQRTDGTWGSIKVDNAGVITFTPDA